MIVPSSSMRKGGLSGVSADGYVEEISLSNTLGLIFLYTPTPGLGSLILPIFLGGFQSVQHCYDRGDLF